MKSEFGTNVIPLNLSRDQLRDGYIGVMNALSWKLHSVF